MRTLATQLNFGGLYGEELCTRAGIDYNVAVDDLDESDFERLYELIDEMGTRLREGDVDPRVYYETLDDGDGAGNGESGDDPDRRRIDVTPIPLADTKTLQRICHGVQPRAGRLRRQFPACRRTSRAAKHTPGLRGRDRETAAHHQQQEQAIEDFEADAEVEREKAELLYANYDLVDDVLSTVQAARQDDVSWDDIEAKFDEGADRGIPPRKRSST